MPSREVTIAAAEGLHARPAAAFVQVVKSTGVPITISKGDGKAVSAASILQVLALGAGQGDTVTISAEGDGAEAALETVARQLENADA